MDKQEIERIVNTYGDGLLRLGYSYFKNTADAEDACQTSFIKIIKHGKNFENKRQEKTFVYKVMANTCKDMLRNPWRKSFSLEHAGEIEEPEERQDSVIYGVNQLETKYRTIIYLYYYEGYKADEIGKILKIPQSTVYTRL